MAEIVISFGPYTLMPARRLLLKGEETVDVGTRALDVLIALTEAAGNVVCQRELLERAWPNVVVTEGSLRVRIANLRKALGDGQGGARYITNVNGRGYCFVAPVTRSFADRLEKAPASDSAPLLSASDHRLPPQLERVVCRNDTVETLATLSGMMPSNWAREAVRYLAEVDRAEWDKARQIADAQREWDVKTARSNKRAAWIAAWASVVAALLAAGGIIATLFH